MSGRSDAALRVLAAVTLAWAGVGCPDADDPSDDPTHATDVYSPAIEIDRTFPEDGEINAYHRGDVMVRFDGETSGATITLIEQRWGCVQR